MSLTLQENLEIVKIASKDAIKYIKCFRYGKREI